MDGRSDLYSFGCVLYELLAGRPPFVAEEPMRIMRMHLQERQVPMRDIRSDLPNGLPELVDRLLEKDRDARPPDAGYVAAHPGRHQRQPGARRRPTPEHEADRRTFMAGSAETMLPDGPGPEGYRETVLADDARRVRPGPGGDRAYRPTVLAGDDADAGGRAPVAPARAPVPAGSGQPQYQAGQGMPPFQPLGDPTIRRARRPAEAPAGAAGDRAEGPQRQRQARQPERRPARLALRPAEAAPPPLGRRAEQRADLRHRGRHRGLRMEQDSPGTLTVTAATVSVANPDKIGCNSTVDVVGTIFTNGNGGPITYQWTKDGQNQPVEHGHGRQRPAAGPGGPALAAAGQGHPSGRGDPPGLHAQRDLAAERHLHLQVRLMNVIGCVPLPGQGLVARRGGLIALTDGAGPGPDALLAALDAVADANGDGAALVLAGTRAALERGGRPTWACAGVTSGGEVAILVHGRAVALVCADGGPEAEVTDNGSMIPVVRTFAGAVVTVRLAIGFPAAAGSPPVAGRGHRLRRRRPLHRLAGRKATPIIRNDPATASTPPAPPELDPVTAKTVLRHAGSPSASPAPAESALAGSAAAAPSPASLAPRKRSSPPRPPARCPPEPAPPGTDFPGTDSVLRDCRH